MTYLSYNWKLVSYDPPVSPIAQYPTLPLVNSNVYSLPISSVIFRFHIQMISEKLSFFCLTYSIKHNAIKVHSYCHKYPNFIFKNS